MLGATCLASFTATLDNTVVAVALRDIQRELGAGVSGLQGVVTAYTVALAALLLTGGTLADVAGRRRIFLTGLLVFAGASVGCALSGSVSVLVAWRAVQGAGAALVIPGGLAVLAEAYPDPAERARAVGVWAATGALALVAGPVVGGLLVAARGWPAVFEVNVPLCAVVAVVVLTATHGERPASGRRVDLPGQLLVTTGLAATTYAVVLAGRDGWDPTVLLYLAVGVAAFVGFGLVERRSSDPLLPPTLIRRPAFAGTALAAFAVSLAVFVLLVFLSLFLQLVQQLDALPAAVRLLPLTGALVVVAPIATQLPLRAAVVTGLLLSATGLALLARELSPGISGGALGVLLGVIGVGLGLTGAPVVAASLDAVGLERRGLGAAAVNAARELGGVVAIGGLGAVVVARLHADLTTRLIALGVPPARSTGLVDSVLRGQPALEVARQAGPGVGLGTLLRLRDAAASSYVASTRLAFLGAAGVLLGSAAVAAVTLRERR